MIWRAIGTIRLFLGKCKDDNLSAFAAQSAFFVILSLIPTLMVFISLVQYTPVTEGMVLKAVNDVFPEYIAPFMISMIREVYSNGVGLISISAVAAIWTSAKGIQYLSMGLNAVYDIEETRNILLIRIHAALYTLALIVAIVLALVLLVFGNAIQALLMQYLPIAAHLTSVILGFRNLIMLAVFVLFFTVLFKVLPNRKAALRSQLPGSVLCALGWMTLSFGISVYVDYFNGFSMYGSLTTLALLMLWLYFGMFILLICGEINNIYEEYWSRRRGE